MSALDDAMHAAIGFVDAELLAAAGLELSDLRSIACEAHEDGLTADIPDPRLGVTVCIVCRCVAAEAQLARRHVASVN